ncbi:c-type cytochrome [Xanthomonas phaseoli]|uniref:Cytochrome c n=1 Tax=Xanthomonas manihotis TaxID=43353 RepID=A0A8I2BW37_XANMN|nr:cytochrome c [Xanthomonas phaseoli]KUF36880.1 cytochrome C biogenesis protein CcdA [Xanthomonas phaseoli pv. manihotis]MBO9719292.1 cytochrome c [Xanthomonas phaseoli pv. manihotis]MBO9755018.1 cytochrome c [Xanthomonas phaseoli pv. manihotis]MBO9760932.1 cytochrome c [Xanthomonas phaseoli pv. manihotis]MBO9763521.1 cytochrome c [Xanthomonas phaseoli pv. manihotis]
MSLLPRAFGAIVALAITALLLPPTVRDAQAQSSDATQLFPQQGFAKASGQDVYQAICQGCHMSAGHGAQGAGDYPALAGNPKLAAGPYVTMMVLDGHAGMPGFADMLDDRQVAEVVSYVRTHFGNDYAERVTIDDVKSLRR